MKALITGVSGFVGPYLKRHLLNNNFEVLGTDISAGKDADFVVDILDSKKIEDLVRKTKPDFVFHLAAQSSVKLSFSKPELTRQVNVKGTKYLLDSVKKNIPDSRVLIVSSADVYGIPEKIPLTEDSELSPISPYGMSRVEQEKLALSYGLNIVISRSFTHTGPGQSPLFVCSDFAKQIVNVENGKQDKIYTGDLSVRRDFTDVRDMVRAYLLALGNCKANDIYNICSGKSYSIKHILDILLGLTDKDVKIKQDPSKVRKEDIPVMEGDNSKFFNATKWKPEIPIEKMLKDLLDYWRKIL